MASSPETPTSADVHEQIRSIRGEVANLTKLMRQMAENKAHEASVAARHEAEELLARSKHAVDDVAGRAKHMAGSVEDHINQKPVQSVLIAFLLGAVIGSLSRR